jgi:phosphoenolpyruvate---glycerone phosphotransferase subunit DhaM
MKPSFGVLLVSHSAVLALGLAELLKHLSRGSGVVAHAGGTSTGEFGTDPQRILSAFAAADCGEGVLIFADMGSAILSVRALVAAGELEHGRAVLVDAPFVEGSITAVVAAARGADWLASAQAARACWGASKLEAVVDKEYGSKT